MKPNVFAVPAIAVSFVAFVPGCAMPSSDESESADVAGGALSNEEVDTPEDNDFFGGNSAARRQCRQLRRQCRRDEEGSCAEYSQRCLVKVGVVGDSLSDEYQGISSQLPGLQWTEQVHELEHVSLGLFGTRPEPRNDGFVLNWARFGQAANAPQWSDLNPALRAACLGGQDDPRLQTIGSLDAQIDGLGAQIANFRVDVALVWVGHNDFFIAQCVGQNPADPAFVGALITRIVGAAVELAQYADAGVGAPRAKVAIVGLAGDAGAINPALAQAASANGITFIDPFNTAVGAIVGEQFATAAVSPPNGFYDVGGTHLVPFTLSFSPPGATPRAASLSQLSPTGTGPCSSFPLGTELCATPAYAEPFQHWDAVHPNTIYMGVVGNQIVLDVNEAFGFAMQTLTEDQLLDNAGL
jgi:hypothetical protein